MQSKTSCFNVGIFKNNLKRFWPVAVVIFLLFMAFLPFTFYSEWTFRKDYFNEDLSSLLYFVPENLTNLNVPGVEFVFAAVAVFAVFGYLFYTRSAYMMSVFPVARKTWIFTNIVSILCLEIVPVVLNVIITILFCGANGLGGVSYLFFFLAQNIGYFLLFDGIALVCVYVSGNYLGAVGSYVVLNFLSYMVLSFISSLQHVFLLGYSPENLSVNAADNVLSPLTYLSQQHIGIFCTYENGAKNPTVTIGGVPALIIYSLAGIALMAVCLFISKVRRTETAGDLISFEWLKKAFQVIVAAFFSVKISELAVCFFRERFVISYKEAFVWMIIAVLICGFIAYYAFEMIARKTLRVFTIKQLKQFLRYSVSMVIVMLAVKGDPTGFEDKMPNAAEIEWAGFNYDRSYTYTTVDAEDIIKLQRMFIENKDNLKNIKVSGVDYADSITFKYKKKDGGYFFRRYYIANVKPCDILYDGLVSALKDPDRMKEGMINPNWRALEAIGGEYNKQIPLANDGMQGEMTWEELKVSKEDIQSLYEAVLADIDEGNVNPLYSYEENEKYINELNFNLRSATLAKSCDDTFYDYDYAYDEVLRYGVVQDTYFDVTLEPSMTNTINKMIEVGLIQSEADLILQSDFYQE